MSRYNIRCEKYSDAYIVVKGSDTIKFKDTFKEFGGSWCTSLKCGPGWLFLYSDKLFSKLQKFLEIIEVETKKDLSLDASQPYIESYTDKSFIIIGNTRPYKDKIKELGGTWNAKLREGKKAWVFPETKRKDVQEWIDKEFDDLTFEEEFEPDLMPSNKKRLL
jgi:hypothetical protein